MTQSMRSWFTELRSRGWATQAAVLVAVVLVVYALVAPVAALVSGWAGLAAAAVAAGLCLLGAGSAMVACRRFRDPQHALLTVLIGMSLRMVIPLGSAVILQFQGGVLAEAGLLCYLVVFYPFTLGAEIALTLPFPQSGKKVPGTDRGIGC